jgi:hypothetical protein
VIYGFVVLVMMEVPMAFLALTMAMFTRMGMAMFLHRNWMRFWVSGLTPCP